RIKSHIVIFGCKFVNQATKSKEEIKPVVNQRHKTVNYRMAARRVKRFQIGDNCSPVSFVPVKRKPKFFDPSVRWKNENDLGQSHVDAYNPRPFSSLITLPTFIRNGEKVPMEVLELMSTHRNARNLRHSGLSYSRSFSEPLSSSRHSNVMSPESTLSPTNPERLRYEKAKCRKINNEQAFLSFLKRDGINHQKDRQKDAYLKDIKMHRHSLTYRGAMLNINRYRLRASSCPDIYRNSMTTIAKEKTQWSQGVDELKNVLLDMVDFSYFADVRFLLFAVSNFFLYTWYDVPYVYLADNAIQIGFTETDASILISVIGIVNMFGEIILGWFGDKKYLTAGVIYAICMGCCGITTALVPLLKSYVGLSIVSGLFGLFIAANYALTSIILVELITLERFTNAYGLLLLIQGIANLVGPPLAGWITDLTGNYDLAFYLSGFFIIISGVLMFILPVHGKFKKYRELKQQNSQCDEDVTQTRTTCNGTTISEKFGKTIFKDGDRINDV
ncbi:Monocarboxylate transporter 12, partial [Pseudolycoriella hygida]